MQPRNVSFLALCLCALEFRAAGGTTLPEVSNVTKIIVRSSDSGWLAIKWITETQQVQKIASLINRHRGGWDKPWYGVPAGSLSLRLYDGRKYCGEFGIGENFFSTQREGSFWSKDAPKEQREELLRLIGDLPGTLKDVMLPEIGEVTRILIRTNDAGPTVKTITDGQQIKEMVGIINGERRGWDKPWFGQPPPLVLLELHDKQGFLVEFGIGTDFFETGDNMGLDSRAKAASLTPPRNSKDAFLAENYDNAQSSL
jgi:hypothetical protein